MFNYPQITQTFITLPPGWGWWISRLKETLQGLLPLRPDTKPCFSDPVSQFTPSP